MRIVIIEDSTSVIKWYRRVLRGTYARVRPVLYERRVSIDSTVAAIRNAKPDLVILDLDLGGSFVDGFSILRRLKKCEETRNVPLYVCSRYVTQADAEPTSKKNRERCIDYGADGVIDIRPVAAKKQIAQLVKKIKRSRASRASRSR